MAFSDRPLSVFSLSSFFPAIIFLISVIEANSHGGITVDLIHRDSPISPLYSPSETRFDRLRKSIDRSNSRASWIKSSFLKSPEAVQAPIRSGRGEYLMNIRIGTPPFDIVAIADTGSDLTWTQCHPCTDCFRQDAPLYDPSKSASYRRVPCSTERCETLGSMGSGCDKYNRCQYRITYGDQSHTVGNLATETLRFVSSSGKALYFRNVSFGCGRDNKGTFSSETSGIIGLGAGGTSIVRQFGRYVGGRFSYCLVPIDSNSTSKISFGADATVRGPGLVKTPLVTQDTFYFLTLEAVSVGTRRIKNTAKSPLQTGDAGNIIIDSGTTLTYLPEDLYQKLMPELKAAVKGTPTSDPQGFFELCYKSGRLSVPPVTAHFSGADVVLRREGTFIEVADGVVCATFMPSGVSGISIFGNLNQIDYLIGYDIDGKELSFLPTDCGRHN